MSSSSFVNGIIAGAGIVMVLMSVGFLYYIAPVENQQGVSSTEIRVAIFLGGLVAAVAIGYEFYTQKQDKNKSDTKTQSESSITEAAKPEIKIVKSETQNDSNPENKSETK